MRKKNNEASLCLFNVHVVMMMITIELMAGHQSLDHDQKPTHHDTKLRLKFSAASLLSTYR